MAFNRKQRLRDNIEAIRTAFILDRERRTATAEEQAILRKYCGFGGLKCILNPAKELTDAVHWAKSDLELFTPTVELHRLVRENSKDDTEYKRYVDAMKQSVLTAFYTPPEITGTIAEALHEHGIRPDRVLEPSAGVGAFVDAVLENKPDADIMAFEKDLMTGKILGHLHPDQGKGAGIREDREALHGLFRPCHLEHPVRRRGCVRPGIYRKPRPGKAFRTEGNTQLLLPEKP